MFKSSKKSFNLEQVYDAKTDEKKPYTISGGNGTDSDEKPVVDEKEGIDYAKLMEPKKERRRRHFSLVVISLTAFIFSLSFSIVLTSAKPYLDEMDPEAGNGFLGFFIAAQPLGQLIFSPIMGYLGNRIGSVRILTMISMLFLAGGFALYACVSAIAPPRRWYLFAARFLIGAAGGSITLCFSYIASATTVKERTKAVSLFQLGQSSAFVVGPAIQAAFAPLGTEFGATTDELGLYWNMYTAPSWLSVVLAFANILVLMPCLFTEYQIAREEGEYLAKRAEEKRKEKLAHGEVYKELTEEERLARMKKPDIVGLIVSMTIFASVQFNFIFLESVGTLLVMEQLGFEEKKAIITVGIAFASAGLYGGVIFASMAPISKRIGERVVLSIGIIFMLLGPVALYPYGGQGLAPFRCKNATAEVTTIAPMETTPSGLESYIYKSIMTNNFDEPIVPRLTELETDEICLFQNSTNPLYECNEHAGCPICSQPWCGELPKITGPQMVIGFVLIITGFPMGASMGNAIFSKIIGPFPQGTWMGVLGAAACAARVLCPICVTNLYSAYGTWAAFGFMTGVMTLILISMIVFYNRLVPYKYEENDTTS